MGVLKARVDGAWVEVGVGGGGDLLLPLDATFPIAPTDEKLILANVAIGNRSLPFFVPDHGRPWLVAPAAWAHSSMVATYNSGQSLVYGLSSITASGTATAVASTTTNAQTRARRMEYLVTAPSTTAVAGARTTALVMAVSDGVSGGGIASMRWGPATGVANTTSRAFCGVQNSAAIADAEPSTRTDCVGMGWDAADTAIQIMHNDSAGVCTKVSLGASFPIPLVDRTDLYELLLYFPPDVANEVNYMVTNLTTGAVATGAITTNLPAAIVTGLLPMTHMMVGGTSSVVGIAIAGWDFWTPL